jgi:hypothetical protein
VSPLTHRFPARHPAGLRGALPAVLLLAVAAGAIRVDAPAGAAPAASATPAAPTAPPACAGPLDRSAPVLEILTFDIRWGNLSGGTGVLRLEPVREEGKPPAWRIESTAVSNSVIDVFYPVRDRAVSVVDAGFERSLSFTKSQREGGFARDEVLEYDRFDGVAYLFRNGHIAGSLRIPDRFQDPVSGLYAFRATGAPPGGTVTMEATDGSRLLRVRSEVLGRETVNTPAGRFDCLKVELFPEKLDGPFVRKKHGHVYLWFTDDACRMPVRMTTDVLIGTVETVLVKAERSPVPG